jgi:hypothetical protein
MMNNEISGELSISERFENSQEEIVRESHVDHRQIRSERFVKMFISRVNSDRKLSAIAFNHTTSSLARL